MTPLPTTPSEDGAKKRQGQQGSMPTRYQRRGALLCSAPCLTRKAARNKGGIWGGDRDGAEDRGECKPEQEKHASEATRVGNGRI